MSNMSFINSCKQRYIRTGIITHIVLIGIFILKGDDQSQWQISYFLMATPPGPGSATTQDRLKPRDHTTYRNDSQVKVAGVKQDALRTHATSSEHVDLEGIRRRINMLAVKGEDGSRSLKEGPSSNALSSQDTVGGNQTPVKSKGFVLESLHANMLLLNRVYFIVFSNIYVFDKHRIICQVDGKDRYHEAEILRANPPEVEGVFYIDDVEYRFDRQHRLSHNLNGQWRMTTTYPDLQSARTQVARWPEQN
ncbi:hypothetical protein FRC12_006901 [Ceratobasidium sp. 428]|nr:hypothetical protein FRC12_006901 [Ceratobasidium sp. 428]